jgi:hypothetical protein
MKGSENMKNCAQKRASESESEAKKERSEQRRKFVDKTQETSEREREN